MLKDVLPPLVFAHLVTLVVYKPWSLSLALQQWRLLPYLAATYVLEHFYKAFFMDFVNIRVGIWMGDKSERQVTAGHTAFWCRTLNAHEYYYIQISPLVRSMKMF